MRGPHVPVLLVKKDRARCENVTFAPGVGLGSDLTLCTVCRLHPSSPSTAVKNEVLQDGSQEVIPLSHMPETRQNPPRRTLLSPKPTRLSKNDKVGGNDTHERVYIQQRRDEHTLNIGSRNEKKQRVPLKSLARGLRSLKAQSVVKKGAGRPETEPGKSF